MTRQINGEELWRALLRSRKWSPVRESLREIDLNLRSRLKSGLVFSFKWPRSSRFPGAQITSPSRWFSRWLTAFQPQRPSGARVTEICFIKLPADRSVWISSGGGLCGLDLSPAVSEGGGILMSRFGILFGTRLGAKSPLSLNILLKHLSISMRTRLSFSFSSIIFLPLPPPPPPPTSRSYLGPLACVSPGALTGAVMEG